MRGSGAFDGASPRMTSPEGTDLGSSRILGAAGCRHQLGAYRLVLVVVDDDLVAFVPLAEIELGAPHQHRELAAGGDDDLLAFHSGRVEKRFDLGVERLAAPRPGEGRVAHDKGTPGAGLLGDDELGAV